MKNILKISYSIIFLLVGTFTVNAAEKVDLLKQIGVLRDYLENLIEGHCKEVIRFIQKFVLAVIQ